MTRDQADRDAEVRRPPRRHRRAVAAPTNPEADPSDDAPGAAAGRQERSEGRAEDPHDAWIRAQRPPHWD